MAEEQEANTELKQKACPWMGDKPCEECRLEVEINMLKPGAPVPQRVKMCVFQAILMVAGSPTPQQQIIPMRMPPPGFNPLVGKG
jgi:hypothetical protein